MEKPKILYTTADASAQSGAFKSLLYMAREMQKHGYRSVKVLHSDLRDSPLLAADDPGRSYFLELPQLRRGRPFRFYISYLVRNIQCVYSLVGIIREERISIVHVNEILDFYGAAAARIAGVLRVWHVRAGLAMPSFRLLRLFLPRITALLASVIVVVSESVGERLFQQRGIDPRKAVVIHDPGPDPAQFNPTVDGTSVRQEFGIDESRYLVVMVGKLLEPKGHEILVRSIPRVLASFPGTRFMIVGGALEGPHHREYEARLKALPSELGIRKNVIFTGYRADIPQIMAAADIVTHCSTFADPFPGVVLQGMSMGKPVIASDLGGPKEQIEHQVSGLLIEPGNPHALAEAICSLLEDEERRASLGRAAAIRVRSAFADDLFFQKLSELYERLIVERWGYQSDGQTGSDSDGEATRLRTPVGGD